MDMLTEAFKGLYPDKEPGREMKLVYSGRFSDYNANVYYTQQRMEFRLSRMWKDVSRDIKIGLIQSLMVKVFRLKKTTLNIDMYNIFLKKLHISVPLTEYDPKLAQSFERVNLAYFDGMVEQANLKWGAESKTRWGSYSYSKDLITINPALQGNWRLLDYVMYHEMLHKRFKFIHKSGRSYHHMLEFRKAEALYPDSAMLEKELKDLSRNNSRNKQSFRKRHKFFNWF
ncbi:M48 family metallopeptidase [Candidatus Woesearchaeota archaeon]|nr:M48 family metallopeptidase [Candidatus Woesearchaeota archaeon]